MTERRAELPPTSTSAKYVGWWCPKCKNLRVNNSDLRVCCFLNATAVRADEVKAR